MAAAENTEHEPTPDASAPDPPTGWGARLRQIGPGLVAAASGVGAGDLVANMIAGSRFGYDLLWAVVLGAVFKLALAEAVARWHMGSGRTMLSGWRTLGRWATTFFGVYVVVWGFVYGATAMSASGLPLNALVPSVPVSAWGALCGLVGLGLVWFGRYRVVEKAITVLVGVMFLTVVGTAALTAPNLPQLVTGLVPRVPEGSLVYLLGLMGGVGGTITMAAYGYWTLAKGWRAPRWIPFMRVDNAVGYVTTAIFSLAMLVVGAELMLGRAITDSDEGLLVLGDVLAADYGPWSRVVFLIGFFAVSFSSLVGVWNGVSLLFADWWRTWLMPREAPPETAADYAAKAGTSSTPFRLYALWLTFPPMLLLLLGKPFQIVIVYGVLGAVFMPFLAATLLWLLNSRALMPSTHRSRWLSNALLVLCVLLFGVVGVLQILEKLQ